MFPYQTVSLLQLYYASKLQQMLKKWCNNFLFKLLEMFCIEETVSMKLVLCNETKHTMLNCI